MIALSTLNSRYSHAAFGLRYLYANLGPWQNQTEIVEFTIQQAPQLIVDRLLNKSLADGKPAPLPKIIGFGVYIWNTKQTLEIVRLLKTQAPEICVVLGGPEVSHEAIDQEICLLADHVIQGEADFLFREFCDGFFSGARDPRKFITGPLPEITKIASPYPYYTDADIQNRVMYVEASRGCPYKCEYCLSSLDKSVRAFDLDRFLLDMENLLERGVRQFKFVDRTFNLSPTTSQRILQFFLDRMELGLFLHFEMVPDRLPAELRDLIVQFPKGSLQFEIGIQTWNPLVAANVSRRQNYEKIRENLAFLKASTGVHTHVDLIVGLPGETWESFAQGFNEVAKLGADEIQVGILKYLKGTPIARHKSTFEMVYSAGAPFTIVQNKDYSAEQIQTMVRFAKFWDLIANSGNFQSSVERLRESESFFHVFFELAEFLLARHGKTYGLPLAALGESVFSYWQSVRGLPEDEALDLLLADFTRAGRLAELPQFLKNYAHSKGIKDASRTARRNRHLTSELPERQRRHVGVDSTNTTI